MIAHLWELRADVTPLARGAEQWARIAGDLAGTADEIVDAARHAMDQGWESEAAERYEAQRRQIVQQIDTFTTVAARIGASLTAIAGLLTDAQEELDRAWLTVSVVPHEVIGAERTLVLHPASPADEELVRSATATARAVRSRLQDQLYDESSRLRENRIELGTVQSDLFQAARGAWPNGAWPGGVTSGVGTVDVVPSGTTEGLDLGLGTSADDASGSASAVSGAAAGGAAGAAATPVLPGIAPSAVSMPDLTGLSAGALAAGAAGLVGGAAARRRSRSEPAPTQGSGMAPMGGMAAGAALRGGGALGRPGGSGRSGGPSSKPVLSGSESEEQKAARVAREKEQAREAKRQLIAERQAERAARRAQRAQSDEPTPPAENKARIEVVEVAPGEEPRSPRG